MSRIWWICAALFTAILGCVESDDDNERGQQATSTAAMIRGSVGPDPLPAGASDSAHPRLVAELRTPGMLSPTRVSASSDGSVIAVDPRVRTVFGFDVHGMAVHQIHVYGPGGVAMDDEGTIYVGDGLGAVRRYMSDGSLAGHFGIGNGELGVASDLAWDSVTGTVFVADSKRHVISAYTSAGVKLYEFGALGSADGQLRSPMSLAVDEEAGLIYVADLGNKEIDVFERAGGWRESFPTTSTAHSLSSRPYGVDIDSQGRIYVADVGQDRVHIFDNEGVHLDDVGAPDDTMDKLGLPMDAYVDDNDQLYVASARHGTIAVYTLDRPEVPLEARLTVHPRVINSKSSGQWVTAYVEVPAACASQLLPESLELAGLATAEGAPTAVGDFDGDEVIDLMVKFDRAALVSELGGPGTYAVDLTGTLASGAPIVAAARLIVH